MTTASWASATWHPPANKYAQDPLHEVSSSISWDDRRQLANDIALLSPTDLPRLLRLIQSSSAKSSLIDSPALSTCSKLTKAKEQELYDLMRPVERHPGMRHIRLACGFDLDKADPSLLRSLRDYVDNCTIPHFTPKENCCICEGLWSSGKVVACGNDACDARVHEECFGIVLREEKDGPWWCPSCLFGRPLMCSVCMQFGGALKPLSKGRNVVLQDDQRWTHVLCALSIPELFMRDVPTMEPVDGFDDIENSRFRYLCSICRKRGGASVICETEGCNVGMHPRCAADAGLMIGKEDKPLGVYCEKHLPNSRVPGAKRWISDEDLVEEILSDASGEDVEDFTDDEDENQKDSYAFILRSTPYLYEMEKWTQGSLEIKQSYEKLSSDALREAKLNVSNRWQSQPLDLHVPVFPPERERRVGLPPMPKEEHLVGAIIEYLPTGKEEYVRAKVVRYDASRKQHLIQTIEKQQQAWATLTTQNTFILHVGDERNEADGSRVRIYRPLYKGERQWRPKPRLFHVD